VQGAALVRSSVEPSRPVAGEPFRSRIVFDEADERCRTVTAWLDLVDESRRFRSDTARVPLGVVHHGPIPAGLEVVIDATLPAGALPPLEAEWGEVRWSVTVKVDRSLAFDLNIWLWLDEIVTDGPSPEAVAGAIEGSDELEPDGAVASAVIGSQELPVIYDGVPGLDLELDRPIARLGEQVHCSVRIGPTKKPLKDLEVGIECVQFFAKENYEEFEADWTIDDWTTLSEFQSIDSETAVQQVELSIPDDQPYSYHGEAFRTQWRVVAAERRKWRLNRYAGAPLVVLPKPGRGAPGRPG